MAVERIESLRQLHFIDCSFDSLNAGQLRGLKRLQELTIRGHNELACWRCLTPWLAKCSAIQFPFSGLETEVSDLKAFSHQAEPTFLRVALAQNSGNIIEALEAIRGLVGLELAIGNDVESAIVERLCAIQNIQCIVLNKGVLNADLVRKLSRLKMLKVLRVQGATKNECNVDSAFTPGQEVQGHGFLCGFARFIGNTFDGYRSNSTES